MQCNYNHLQVSAVPYLFTACFSQFDVGVIFNCFSSHQSQVPTDYAAYSTL